MGIRVSLFYFSVEFFYLYVSFFCLIGQFFFCYYICIKCNNGQKKLKRYHKLIYSQMFFKKEIFHSKSSIAYHYILYRFKCLNAEVRIFHGKRDWYQVLVARAVK